MPNSAVPNMIHRDVRPLFACFSCFLLLTSGCNPQVDADKKIADPVAAAVEAAQAKAVEVVIDNVGQDNVQLYIYADGRTVPANFAEIRARISGYLEKLFFAPGAIVKEGDQLALIEQDQYKAALDAAKAEVATRKAQADLAEANLQRAKTLHESKTISPEEYQTYQANRDVAKAAIDLANSNLRNAELNLQYTEMRSPITGKTTKNLVDVGNYVSPSGSQAVLLSVAQLDPMFIEFKLSDRQFADLKDRAGLKDAFTKAQGQTSNTEIKPDENKLALTGTPIGISLMTGVNVLDFDFNVSGKIIALIDNQINFETGQITLRGEVKNPLLKTAGAEDYMLYPGQICRVRIPYEKIDGAVLIREEAIMTDLDTKYVFVIGKGKYQPVNAMGQPLRYKTAAERFEEKDSEGKIITKGVREKIELVERGTDGEPVPPYETTVVHRRDIKIGRLLDSQSRIVLGGLKPGEEYVVKGVQRARVGMEIKPVTLPDYNARREADAAGTEKPPETKKEK